MKLSLRNLALAAVVSVAGSAMAQDAPFTVEKDWFKTFSGTSVNEHRFGTGFEGKVYLPDKTNSQVKVITADSETTLDLGAVAVNMTHDDAGNLIFHRSWASAANDCTKWSFYNAKTGEVKDVEFILPEGAVNARMDQIGRVIGDVFSEEGALMLFTPNTADKPYFIQVANGAQITPTFTDYPVAESGPYAFDATTLGQWSYTYEEVLDMGDDWVNAVVIRRRGNGPYAYIDNEWKALPKGAGTRTSDGFDCFVLNDVLYLVLPAGDINYTDRFVVLNAETGEEYYNAPADIEVSTGGAAYGAIVANKVDDTTVQLYICGQNAVSTSYAGQFTVKAPGEVPPTPAVELPNVVFVRGSVLDWAADYGYSLAPQFDLEEPVANENGEYVYKAGFDYIFGEFKLADAEWGKINFGAAEGEALVAPGTTVNAWNGSNVNFNLGGKQYTDVTMTFYYNPEEGKASRLEFEGTEYVETPVLPLVVFVRGDILEWAADYGYSLAPQFDVENPVANENGEYEYKAGFDYFYGSFKLGGQSWDDFNYGAQGEDPVIAAGKTNQAWAGSSVNFDLQGKQYTDVTMTFYYNPDSSKASWLKFEGTEYVEAKTTDKAVFAYDLVAEKADNGGYKVTYKATGDAANAVLVLTVADGDKTVEVEMGPVTKGENTFTLEGSNLPENGKYNWSVRIHNYSIPETVVSTNVNVGGSRAGLVVFTDTEYPEVLGKVVIGRTKNGGLDIYAPDGTLEAEKVHANCAAIGGTSANNSSPMDGKQRKTEAVMASWGDTSYGVVAFDIANLDAEPYSVFEGEKQGNGTVMNGDVKVGSGTPCVAFWGKGDATRMYTFDEDIFNNSLTYNVIGTAKTVGTALIDAGFGSLLANTNVGMWSTEGGLFLTQIRANGMEPGTPGLSYYDVAQDDVVWTSANMLDTDPTFLPSAAAGVCINPAGDLLAVATYTGIEVYLLSWENGMPVLEKYQTVATPYSAGNRTNIQFDLGNNIHVTNQANGYFTVALADEEPIANTAAPKASIMDVQSGVANIAVEAENADAVYYNLNGVRVDADNLVPGVYVKVVGKVATKVVVK